MTILKSFGSLISYYKISTEMLYFIPSYLCKFLICHYFIAKRVDYIGCIKNIYYYQETCCYLSFSSHRATKLDKTHKL